MWSSVQSLRGLFKQQQYPHSQVARQIKTRFVLFEVQLNSAPGICIELKVVIQPQNTAEYELIGSNESKKRSSALFRSAVTVVGQPFELSNNCARIDVSSNDSPQCQKISGGAT